MDPLTLLLRLPLLPVTGVVRLGELIQEQVEQEQYHPAAVGRQLEEISEAHASGEISDEELAEAEAQAAGRLIQPVAPGSTENGDRS
jgi:hypothetical protein